MPHDPGIFITQALLGEHGAMYPLLAMIERSTPSAALVEIKNGAACLRSALMTHARLEEELLRPAILPFLPPAPTGPDGKPLPTDHEVIETGLEQVLACGELQPARQLMLDTLAKTRTHFHKEETVLFPIAERELTAETQRQLGVEWARRRGVSLN
jgi:hypothetical protein